MAHLSRAMSVLRQGAKHLLARYASLRAHRELGFLAISGSNFPSLASIQSPRYIATLPDNSHLNSRLLANKSPITRINLEQRRFRRKRSSKQDDEVEDDEDNDDDDAAASENPLLMDDILGETSDGSERLTINISSLRLDTFCKTAFSMTRAKVEELFYKGDIYINGQLATKKSEDLSINDEIDVVKSIDPENSKILNIRRAIIVELPDKASEHGRLKLGIQRWQNLVIESKELKGRGQE